MTVNTARGGLVTYSALYLQHNGLVVAVIQEMLVEQIDECIQPSFDFDVLASGVLLTLRRLSHLSLIIS